MDIAEIGELESSVQSLVSTAKIEIEAKRLEQQRDEYYQQALAVIEKRLHPLLEEVETTLATLPPEEFADSLTRRKLEEKAEEIRQRIAAAPDLAGQAADRQMILNEERLLDEQMMEQTNRWREALKEDLLEMISEQTDFYSATDAAVAIRSFSTDLKTIGALEEVVEALIEQINSHSQEGPVAKLRGSHDQTLNFIYQKAMENRSRVERYPNVQPRVRHRTSEKRPSQYNDLAGKVVVFGGHDRLETAVRNRLRDSNVELVWYSVQSGLKMAEQGESHVAHADLVLVVTGYASHSLTAKATQACQKAGISPEMINTTGMTKVLETIEYGLKAKLMAQRLSTA